MESENQAVVTPQVESKDAAENTDNASAFTGGIEVSGTIAENNIVLDMPTENTNPVNASQPDPSESVESEKTPWVDPHQKVWMAMDVLRIVSQQGHSFFGTTSVSRELIETAEQTVLNHLKGDN